MTQTLNAISRGVKVERWFTQKGMKCAEKLDLGQLVLESWSYNSKLELGARDEPIRTDRESRSGKRAKPSCGGPGGEGRGKCHSRCPRGRGCGPCLRTWHFQCGGAAFTRRAESTNRRGHPDPSHQGS